MKNKKHISIGDNVYFISGNLFGLYGTIIKVDFNSKDKIAIFGYLHTVQLSSGEIVLIEKSDHWEYYELTKPKYELQIK